MSISKIQLIVPPTDLHGVGYSGSMIPLGALSLASYIGQRNPDVLVEVIDGTVVPYEQIVSRIDADLVGISALTGNYEIGKKIISQAKENGAVTVVGNHHARYLYTECEKDPGFGELFPDIDYLIETEYAEGTFDDLITAINRGATYVRMGSLAYRKGKNMHVNGRIKQNKHRHRMKDLIGRVENISKYSENYNLLFAKWHDDAVNIINTAQITGCLQGAKRPCSYCCLTDFSFSGPSEDEFWDEMRFLEDSGFNYVFEACNSFSSLDRLGSFSQRGTYLKRLAGKRPADLSIGLMVYAKAEELTDTVLSYFKQMNVKRVILGLDSGSEKILSKGIGKSAAVKHNLDSVKRLGRAGIQVFGCFVPAAKGETPETLEETNELVRRLMEFDNVSTIEYTALAPMPGSSAWNEIKQGFWNRFGRSDVVNVLDLSRYYVETQTSVSWELIEKSKRDLKAIADSKGIVFGGYY